MTRIQRFLVVSLTAMLALGSFGCGSDTDDFIFTGSSNAALQGPATFAGRFNLGGFSPAGATIEVQSLDGQILARTETDVAGNYFFHDFRAPADFRVVARLGPDAEFASEVRGFSSDGKVTGMNVATSLASAYLRSHPGETLESAEDRVRRVLHFSPTRPLDQDSEESTRSQFSQFVFFAKAAENGGWMTYRDTILSLMESGEDSPLFNLRREHLLADFAGLDPALAEPLLKMRDDERFRGSLLSLAAHPVPDLFGRVTGTSPDLREIPAVLDARSSVLAQSNFSLLDTLAGVGVGGVVGQVTGSAWTHIADGLNLNYGTTTQLEAIQASLKEMQAFLDDIETLLREGNLFTEASQIASDVNFIGTANQDLFASPASQFISENEQPFQPSSAVNNLVSRLLGFQDQVSLSDISGAMLGVGGQQPYLAASRDTLLQNSYGIISDGTWGNFGAMTNSIIDDALRPFSYYAGYQQLGANILGEIPHLGTEVQQSDGSVGENPVTALNEVSPSVYNVIIDTKKQRGLLPFYIFQDNVFVDLQAGLMWHTVLQPESSLSDASKAAFNKSVSVTAHTQLLTKDSTQPQGLPVGSVTLTYDDWHLATEDELETLQNRARFLQDKSLRDDSLPGGSGRDVGDYDSVVRSLHAFGFTGLDALNDNGSVLRAFWEVKNNGEWELGNTGAFDPNTEFFLNQGPPFPGGVTSDKRPYLICRNIGEPIYQYASNASTADTPYPTSDWWTSISSSEFPFLGHVTGFASTGTVTPTQLGATLNWTVNVGGTYTLGLSPTATVSLPSRTYTAQIPTHTGQESDASVALTDMNDLVWYTSSDLDLLEVTPSGRMYWHVDSDSKQTTNITAHVFTTDGRELTTTSVITVTPPARELVGVQIFPRNRFYQVLSGSPKKAEQYYCLAFYSDNTSEDVTDQVVWTLQNNDGSPVDPNLATLAGMGDVDAGNFVGGTPRNDTQLQIKASLGTDTREYDTVLLELSNGVTDPDPNGV